jgi:hypothetical protein
MQSSFPCEQLTAVEHAPVRDRSRGARPGEVLRRRAAHLVVEHVRSGDDKRPRSARL